MKNMVKKICKFSVLFIIAVTIVYKGITIILSNRGRDATPVARAFSLSQIYNEVNKMSSSDVLFNSEVDFDDEYQKHFEMAYNAKDEYEYYMVLNSFMALLNDGHTMVRPNFSPSIIGNSGLHIAYIDDEYYIVGSKDQTVAPLFSKIEKINGIPINRYIATKIEQYIGVKTPLRREYMISRFLSQGKQGETVQYTIRTPSGEEKDVSCIYLNISESQSVFIDILPVQKMEYKSSNFIASYVRNDENTILYLNILTFREENKNFLHEYYNYIVPLIDKVDGVIMDVRFNGGGNSLNGTILLSPFIEYSKLTGANGCDVFYRVSSPAIELPMYLYRNVNGAKNLYNKEFIGLIKDKKSFSIKEDKLYPALGVDYNIYNEDYLGDNIYLPMERVDKIDKPLTVLTNYFSGSAVDTFADLCKELGVTTIGTNTGGFTTNCYSMKLDTGYSVQFSTGIPYSHDGHSIQNYGIKPDIFIDYNIQDLMNGEDSYINMALDFLKR
ncbi:MAG: hypothetical protein IKU54_04955 [Oscillospiraceae bacterium]|nr:hypothetical protein [Oscillospiraceae bacterium]